MTTTEPVRHLDQLRTQIAAAIRQFEILADTITEECCEQVYTALILCRGEISRRAEADEFFTDTHAQTHDLRTLLLTADTVTTPFRPPESRGPAKCPVDNVFST